MTGKLKLSTRNKICLWLASSLLLVSAASWSQEEAGQGVTSTDSSGSESRSSPVAGASVIKAKVPDTIVVTDLSFKRETQDFLYDKNINPGDPSNPRQSRSRRVVSYDELRGINTELRAELIKMGYVVLQGKPAASNKEQADDFSSIVERIGRGEFGDAQYVLQGTVTDVSLRNTREKIQGTDDFSYGLSVSLLAEFSLIETESLKVLASFSAQGSGSDSYLGKENARFVPDNARIAKDLLASFNAQSRRKLIEQLPTLRTAGGGFFGKPEPIFSGGDPATLKIYKVDDDKIIKDKGKNNKAPVTIYR